VQKIILLNPATIPPSVDILKIQGMPQRILADMQDSRLFNENIKCEIFILIGKYDDVVPNYWVLEFAKAQNAEVKFLDDDHSFSYNMEKLPGIITEFLGKNINQG
jgi:alpha/beta superfamily hydrolase